MVFPVFRLVHLQDWHIFKLVSSYNTFFSCLENRKISRMSKNLMRIYVKNQHTTKMLLSLYSYVIQRKMKMNELSRNASHLKNLHGVIAVFQYLTANISENNKVSRLSYMNLEEAFALFLSYHEDNTEYSIRDSYQRNQFKNLLCLHYICQIHLVKVKRY